METSNQRKQMIALGTFIVLGVVFAVLFWQYSAASGKSSTLTVDQEIAIAIEANRIRPLELNDDQPEAKVLLGQMLFFDKELSGNRDISCATCHHPSLATGDGLPLPIGVGGEGLGVDRTSHSPGAFIPRNAPEIFNRGVDEWTTMFWDGRVATAPYEEFDSPADELLPEGIDSVLAAQAMFPPTSREEMRGHFGDLSRDGVVNEVARIDNSDFENIWRTLTNRVLESEEYQELFQEAYPNTPLDEIGFEHIANAIAAFEIDAFSFNDSPWDLYMAGDQNALTEQEKEGAVIFFGQAQCAQCHTGTLFTDQRYYNIGVPQFGPGKNGQGLDLGRFLVTGNDADWLAFRTPTLRNVGLTGPYMHNGAYGTLEEAVRHHLDIETALVDYSYEDHLPVEMLSLIPDEENVETNRALILDNITPKLEDPIELSEQEFEALIAFLHALSSKSAPEQILLLVPDSVPSGLPVVD